MASLEDINIEDLNAGFALVSESLDDVTKEFYKELFQRYPSVKPLFEGVEIDQQRKKLASSLRLVMKSLENPDALVSALKEMGRRHQGYGATPDLYPPVAETLLDVFKVNGGEQWTNEMSRAWDTALNVVAEVMVSAMKIRMRVL